MTQKSVSTVTIYHSNPSSGSRPDPRSRSQCWVAPLLGLAELLVQHLFPVAVNHLFHGKHVKNYLWNYVNYVKLWNMYKYVKHLFLLSSTSPLHEMGIHPFALPVPKVVLHIMLETSNCGIVRAFERCRCLGMTCIWRSLTPVTITSHDAMRMVVHPICSQEIYCIPIARIKLWFWFLPARYSMGYSMLWFYGPVMAKFID